MDLLLDACSEQGTGLVLVTHNPSFAQAADVRLFLERESLPRISMRGGPSRAGHDSVVIITLGIDDKAERENL